MDRRTLLKGGAAGVVGIVGGAVIGKEVLADESGAATTSAPAETSGAAVAFRGPHQAGIATPPPPYAAFAAFDVVNRTDRAVAPLLTLWTIIAEALAEGRAVDGDTGETKDMGPGALTVTFGLGPSLFDDACAARADRPAGLIDLPAFPGDQLDPAWNGGDLLVQVCAETATHVSHALRQLRNAAEEVATLRWVQHGFLPHAAGKTPRNLFGQYDGTVNPRPGTPDFDGLVWVGDGHGAEWMTGGTYLALRRIRMLLTEWDATDLTVQEAALGRKRDSGAPLSGGEETTPMDLAAVDANGNLLIPTDAHVRIAKQNGAGMLRRGYSFDNSPPAGAPHQQDAGLMFVSYVRDPASQFVPMQQALSASDALNRFLVYTSASLWAIPGGATSGPIAEDLFS